MIRSAWTLGWGAVVTLWYCLRVLRLSLLGRTEALCGECDDIARSWSSAILRAAGVKVHLRGAEHFFQDRAQLIVSNHESWFDLFALMATLPVETRFVAKKELARIPLFGRAWKACGHVPVNRSDRSSAIESLNEAGRRIMEGGLTVLMFPEGTRTSDGSLQRFKKGAFVLAIQANAPIVPVAVIGTRSIMRKGSFRVRKGDVHIHVGRPIPVQGLVHADRDALIHEARSAVAELRGGEGPTSLLSGQTAA